ncbi:MAG: ABC transporter ATP-binding protein [Caldilineaceae bacterium]|nr:ABC transporter ATP-binding protein [Caldilineaceae bacterium]
MPNNASIIQSNIDLQQVVKEPNKLRRLWKLMTGYQQAYLGATASLGLAAGANTATFLLLRYFIDDYLGSKADSGNSSTAVASLWLILAGFVSLALIQAFFTFQSRKLAAQTAEGIARRIRNYLYDHLQRLPFSYHDKMQTGELIQRTTSDVDAIRRFFADQAIESGRVMLLFIINFIAIWFLNWQLALLSVVAIPVVLLISVFFFRMIEKRYEAYQNQAALLSPTVQENLSGVRVVKAFARQGYEADKFDGINWKKYLLGRKLLITHATYWPITDLICGAQMLTGFAVGALMTINGTLTIGEYLAYAGLVIWIIWPMRNLGRLIVQMSTGLVSLERVAAIIQVDREAVHADDFVPTKPLQGELIFSHVGLRYNDHDEEVLHDISFHCKPGQRIALLGPTGSGKTSLVNLLPRFYDYTAGRIVLDGVELQGYSRSYLRQQIGIVEQEPFLFSRTIRDNITYGAGREVTQAEVEAAARAAAIHEVIISKFPEGYDTLVGEKGITLSGGQKQRIAIARTLLKDPTILILDDSTSAVDMETEALIRRALQHLMKGRTTFLIAHRVQSVMDADQILVFQAGRIVQRGTHEELLAQAGFYRRIYEAQTQLADSFDAELADLQSEASATATPARLAHP